MKKIVITKEEPKGVIVDLTEQEKIKLQEDIIKTRELKDAEQEAETKKASAKSKLLALGLTEEEIKLTFGI